MNINTFHSAFLVSWCYELKIFQLDLLQSSDSDRNQERVEVSRSVNSQRKAVFLSTNVGRFFIPKFNEALQNFLTKFNLGGIWERPKKIRKFLVLSLAAAVQYRLCLMTIVYLFVIFFKSDSNFSLSLYHDSIHDGFSWDQAQCGRTQPRVSIPTPKKTGKMWKK